MIEFKLPSLGADMEEGTLLEWKIQPGDPVRRGQIVAVVDTSKAAVEVESWDEGTVVEVLTHLNQTIPVGTAMAVFAAPGEDPLEVRRLYAAQHPVSPIEATGTAAAPAAPIAAVTAPESAAPVAEASAAETGRITATPAARRRARELEIDLGEVKGTGRHGIVMIEDVERAAKVRTAPVRDKAAEIRRTIAAAMSRSKREIPHYYLAERVPMAAALAWLREANAGKPITERCLPAALQLKAVARALKQYPELNGFFRDGSFHPAPEVHVGVAIALRQGGLIAPALHAVDTTPIDALMRALLDLVKRTRAGSLRSSELSDPTVTVTNLGDQGVESVFGVIYPPQVALVGFGRIAEQPYAENGGLKVMPMVTVSLAADHRVSDGHRGALFLAAVREALQRPQDLCA